MIVVVVNEWHCLYTFFLLSQIVLCTAPSKFRKVHSYGDYLFIKKQIMIARIALCYDTPDGDIIDSTHASRCRCYAKPTAP